MKIDAKFLIFLLFPHFLFSQEIELGIYASGFTNPLSIKNAGDNRLFVVERGGLIKIVNTDGSVNNTPFLDIDSRVLSGGERGLLGLAFHPQYASNGFFFVNYTDNNGDTVVSRFITNPPNSNTVDPSTETVLINVEQPSSNHNGGDLAFGNDGYLYIGLGDGGSSGDPGDRAQNLTTMLGKMLRINVDNSDPGLNYAIPSDNPFPNTEEPNALPEIWAYGLRNPWRFSFDRETHDLWIGDVGQGQIEEIDMVPLDQAAVNYGWRCYEGDQVYDTSGNCPSDINELTFPISQYTHSSSGNFKCSITGGYRYRGTAQPNLNGLYFFADYCSNEIGILENNGGSWNMTFTTPYSGNGWTAFGEDVNGEIYIVGIDSGNVYRLLDPSLNIHENKLLDINIFPNPATHVFTVKSTNPQIVIATVNIYNLQGKLVKSVSENIASEINIDTKTLSKGFYLTEIISQTGAKTTQKLIIK
ncbi:PQQ-dependent sugar dehydrogenase [Xanthomarina sp. F2636L]|uniref:PQQ-dependent sugar dehydrogenase n=1 Tax=Xanthomarina sp. F2636L TaxID=2996018 RepID=UPI00225E2C6D|nr:PQQ-dependent sugar dehydrogenase [Xanthomarina sp. F2636L]MCX7552210.1 PQQ-dependent sugar dehydrogenase [Xanthomarina sp. F2636L]